MIFLFCYNLFNRKELAFFSAMQKSVLEQELARRLEILRADLRNHDRAVLLGFIFSCIPLLPVSVIGLLFSLMNYWLYRSGKLDLHERRMVVSGVWIGLINTFIGVAVTYFALMKFGAVNWDSILQAYLHLLREFASNFHLPWRPKEQVI